jgi:hypothetical protein
MFLNIISLSKYVSPISSFRVCVMFIPTSLRCWQCYYSTCSWYFGNNGEKVWSYPESETLQFFLKA